MKFRFVFTSLFWLSIPVGSWSQVSCSGTVTDATTGLPVIHAAVKLLGSTSGVYTDEYGNFNLQSSFIRPTISVSHISYNTVQVKVGKNGMVNVSLEPKTFLLDAVDVESVKPRDVLDQKPFYISDYEFYGDYIVMLAYPFQKDMSPQLMLANMDGDTLAFLKISRPQGLFHDCFGDVYLISGKTAFKVDVDSTSLSLSSPLDRDEFFVINDILVSFNNDHYYLRSYSGSRQRLSYFHYTEEENEYTLFCEISDKAALGRQAWGAYFDGTEDDIRFQELIMNKAVCAPLFVISDTVCVFNFLSKKIELFDAAGKGLANISMQFTADKFFANEMTADPISGRMFMLFRKEGISTLKEVDRHTGQIILSIGVPDFVFIEKIKVYNGKLWFLYREKINDEYKRLYSMPV